MARIERVERVTKSELTWERGYRIWIRRTAWLLMIAAAAAVNPASAQTQDVPFSVRDILSYSFPSGLVAAPVGDRIAWIENREGERNIWVADGPEWRGRAITSYSG